MLLFFSFCICWTGCPHDCLFSLASSFFPGIRRKFWMLFYLRFSNSHLYLCLLYSTVRPLFDVSRFFFHGVWVCAFFSAWFSPFYLYNVFPIHSSSPFLCTHPDPNTNEQNYYLWTFIVWISFLLVFLESSVAIAILLGWLPAHVKFLQDKKYRATFRQC